jgi:hypothetical protein
VGLRFGCKTRRVGGIWKEGCPLQRFSNQITVCVCMLDLWTGGRVILILLFSNPAPWDNKDMKTKNFDLRNIRLLFLLSLSVHESQCCILKQSPRVHIWSIFNLLTWSLTYLTASLPSCLSKAKSWPNPRPQLTCYAYLRKIQPSNSHSLSSLPCSIPLSLRQPSTSHEEKHLPLPNP